MGDLALQMTAPLLLVWQAPGWVIRYETRLPCFTYQRKLQTPNPKKDHDAWTALPGNAMTTSVVGACVWGLVSYVLKLGNHDQQLDKILTSSPHSTATLSHTTLRYLYSL